MVCLLAAPWVQLSVSTGSGWPHNALRHHWLMPVSCHFRDCKNAAGHESDLCKRRYNKCPDLYLFSVMESVYNWLNVLAADVNVNVDSYSVVRCCNWYDWLEVCNWELAHCTRRLLDICLVLHCHALLICLQCDTIWIRFNWLIDWFVTKLFMADTLLH